VLSSALSLCFTITRRDGENEEHFVFVLAARTTGPYGKKHKTDSETCFSVTPPLQARRHFAAGAARLLLIVAVLLLLLNLAALRCSRRLLLILQPGDVSCGVASLREQEGGARLPRMDEDGPRRLRPTGRARAPQGLAERHLSARGRHLRGIFVGLDRLQECLSRMPLQNASFKMPLKCLSNWIGGEAFF
jgi:hypothetical protein